MKKAILNTLIGVAIVASAALGIAVAQQPAQQQPSPLEQALGTKLMAEIDASLRCSSSMITVQALLTAAQARIKALEEKYEPKSPDKPNQ